MKNLIALATLLLTLNNYAQDYEMPLGSQRFKIAINQTTLHNVKTFASRLNQFIQSHPDIQKKIVERARRIIIKLKQANPAWTLNNLHDINQEIQLQFDATLAECELQIQNNGEKALLTQLQKVFLLLEQSCLETLRYMELLVMINCQEHSDGRTVTAEEFFDTEQKLRNAFFDLVQQHADLAHNLVEFQSTTAESYTIDSIESFMTGLGIIMHKAHYIFAELEKRELTWEEKELVEYEKMIYASLEQYIARMVTLIQRLDLALTTL